MAQAISNLPVGAKVKFGKYSVNGETAQSIIWLIVAKNHSSTPAYPSNSCTLLTEKIIDLRAFDAQEPQAALTVHRDNGNNRYRISNIDQWLNSANGSGEWYSTQHGADNPPSAGYVSNSTEYSNRPGFLNGFTSEEINSILTTNIRVGLPPDVGGVYEDLSRKVFLPSFTELGVSNSSTLVEGTRWGYFSNNNALAVLTSQAFTNSPSTRKPSSVSSYWEWLLRTPKDSTKNYVLTVASYSGATSSVGANTGWVGIRPALNVASSLKVSDTTDSEGCYVVTWNSAPNTPSIISVPAIYGGKVSTISWAGVTDPDGDAVTYQLECSTDGGSYTQIYKGTALSYSHIVGFGTSNVTYRVKAIDPSGESSAYTTSTTIAVINNYAPLISGADRGLGVKSEGFTGTYYVTDANNDAVTVTEFIDGVQIRSLVATLGENITYGITGNTWLTLSNGSHTFTIRATDGRDSSVRTYTFTKSVDSFTIENATPWQTNNMASRIMMVVTKNIPTSATFKVEVCNNGYDTTPTWEDATSTVLNGRVHVFTNTTKTASQWGVKFRVTVNRNGATGACYVSSIGGNFE